MEPTSPLTTTYDLDKAIELIVKNRADSLISLYHTSDITTHSITNSQKIKELKVFFNVKKNKRRQDLDKTYFMDGSLYICDVNFLLKNKLIVGNNTVGFITSKVKSFEIDDFIDYEIIKFLKKNEKNFKKGNELYKKTSKIIPGGVQLLSKRPEIFLPDQWPSYYKSAKDVI